MPDWKNEIRIAAPIQKVWDTLVDYPHASEWQPGVKRATIETTRSFGSGTRIKVEFATQTTYMTVLESIPPRRLKLNLDRSGTTGESTFVLSKDDTGTIVEHSLTLELSLVDRVFTLLIGPSLKKDLAALKTRVEKAE